MSSAIITVCIGLILWFSQDCLRAAGLAASVFATGVMPALFPMMVIAGLPLAAKRRSTEGSRSRPSAWRAVTAKAVGAASFAFIAGSPAGARRIHHLFEGGRLSKGMAERLYVAAGVLSPLFFLGTLTLWTGNAQTCAVMLAAHWLGAGVTGIVYGLLRKGAGRLSQMGGNGFRPYNILSNLRLLMQHVGADSISARHLRQPPQTDDKLVIRVADDGSHPLPSGTSHGLPPNHQAPNDAPTPSLLSALPNAIASAAQALLSVCGAMMLFSIAAALMRNLLDLAFPAWAMANPMPTAVLHALLEIGGGANAVIKASLVQGDGLYALLCALCSFGGLSIWIQNVSVAHLTPLPPREHPPRRVSDAGAAPASPCSGKRFSPATLLLFRAVHGSAAYGICRLLLLIWPQTVQTGTIMAPPLAHGGIASPLPQPGSVLPVLPALGLLLALAALGAWQKSKTCSPRN